MPCSAARKCDYKTILSSGILDDHRFRRHRTGPLVGMYKCQRENCSEEYANSSELTKHVDRFHEQKKRFFCQQDNCGKGYYFEAHLRRHISWIHDPVMLECEECGKSFNKLSLVEHMLRQHQTTPFECPAEDCQFSTLEPKDLVRHVEEEHNDRNQEETWVMPQLFMWFIMPNFKGRAAKKNASATEEDLIKLDLLRYDWCDNDDDLVCGRCANMSLTKLIPRRTTWLSSTSWR